MWDEGSHSLNENHGRVFLGTCEAQKENGHFWRKFTLRWNSSVLIGNNSHISFFGPWWWSSGQRPRLLLQRSEFESCWLLNLYEKTKMIGKEAGVGPSFKKQSHILKQPTLMFGFQRSVNLRKKLLYWFRTRTRSYKKHSSANLLWILLRQNFWPRIPLLFFWCSKIQRRFTLECFL